LIQEGDQNDPQLKRLQREIAEVNKLFDDWERQAALDDERKNASKGFNDHCDGIEMDLNQLEKILTKACKAPLPRDVDSVRKLEESHRDFEHKLSSFNSNLKQLSNHYERMYEKNPRDKTRLNDIYNLWEQLNTLSKLYSQRLKTLQITLASFEEVTHVVVEFKKKLSLFESMPTDMEGLRRAHDDLMILEADIQEKQVKNKIRLANLALFITNHPLFSATCG